MPTTSPPHAWSTLLALALGSSSLSEHAPPSICQPGGASRPIGPAQAHFPAQSSLPLPAPSVRSRWHAAKVQATCLQWPLSLPSWLFDSYKCPFCSSGSSGHRDDTTHGHCWREGRRSCCISGSGTTPPVVLSSCPSLALVTPPLVKYVGGGHTTGSPP